MVKITKSKNFNDEVKRTNHLQAIEKVATTEQLAKLEKLATNKDMIALLDSFEI